MVGWPYLVSAVILAISAQLLSTSSTPRDAERLEASKRRAGVIPHVATTSGNLAVGVGEEVNYDGGAEGAEGEESEDAGGGLHCGGRWMSVGGVGWYCEMIVFGVDV